jgi:hypothetical protein
MAIRVADLKNLLALNEEETALAAKTEATIDERVGEQLQFAPKAFHFAVARTPDMGSNKIFSHLATKYEEGGWKFTFTADVITLTQQGRRGRKPGSKNRPKVTAPLAEAAPAGDPAAVVTSQNEPTVGITEDEVVILEPVGETAAA